MTPPLLMWSEWSAERRHHWFIGRVLMTARTLDEHATQFDFEAWGRRLGPEPHNIIMPYLRARPWWIREAARVYAAEHVRRASYREEHRRMQFETQQWHTMSYERLMATLNPEQQMEYKDKQRVTEASQFTNLVWRFYPSTNDAAQIVRPPRHGSCSLPNMAPSMTVCVLPNFNDGDLTRHDVILGLLAVLRCGNEYEMLRVGYVHDGGLTAPQHHAYARWIDAGYPPLGRKGDGLPVPEHVRPPSLIF